MFLRRKLENERDDVICSGLIEYLEKFLGAYAALGVLELSFFSSIQ